ncbi:hypothetical protein FRC08_015471 [Ceratobasidium sp. 394]|nr:hypothetical protein FRC08_015471 [Ceratobasidium sp. 394]
MSSAKHQNAATPAPSRIPRESAKSDEDESSPPPQFPWHAETKATATIHAEGDEASAKVALGGTNKGEGDEKEAEEGKETTGKATASKGTGSSKTQTLSAQSPNKSTEPIDKEDVELAPSTISAICKVLKAHKVARMEEHRLAIARELAAQKTEAAKQQTAAAEQQTLRDQLKWIEALDRMVEKLGGDEARPLLQALIGQTQGLSGISR